MRTCLKNHKANVLDKISKDEIRSELSLRGIKFLMDDLKPALLAKLVEEMAGIHRLPALLHFKPNATLRECFLERYEVLEVEPLHAIKGHIYNMYEDIPGRLPALFNGSRSNEVSHHVTTIDQCRGRRAHFPSIEKGGRYMHQSPSRKRFDESVCKIPNSSKVHGGGFPVVQSQQPKSNNPKNFNLSPEPFQDQALLKI